MNKTPVISVIVPIYKTEKYIDKCLRTLCSQDISLPYEIIAVNDGTPDHSADIAREYAKRFGFIKVIDRENGGLSAARNTGLAAARGEFVAFVDSDDFVACDYLSKLYGAATDTGADIVCCNYYNTSEDGEHAIKCVLKPIAGVYPSKVMLRCLLHDVTLRSYVWNKLFRRSLFTEHNILFPVGIKFEDVNVMPQLFYYSHTITVIKDHLYNYVRRSGSITGSLKKSDVRDYIESYARLRRFFESENIFEQNRLNYYLLRKKVSVTVFGMLVRCWVGDPANTHVFGNYKTARDVLKVYSSDKYYYADNNSLSVILK